MSDVPALVEHLDDRQLEILRAAAEAGGRVSVIATGGMNLAELGESGWPSEVELPLKEEVDALVFAMCLDRHEAGSGWAFGISLTGRQVIAEAARLAAVPEGAVDPAATHWDSIEKHRRSIYEAWFRHGAQEAGVDVELTSLSELNDATRAAVVRQLHEADLVILAPGSGLMFGGLDRRLPDTVRPSAKTVAEYGGWPSPDNAQQQLLAALDAAIADEDTPPEDRSKLEQVRGQVTELAVGTAWTVLTAWLGLSA